MSQTTLLEEVTSWSPETCGQELMSVLPKLVSMYQNTNNWEESIRILRIISEMFLPHLRVSDLEEECFSKVLPKVAKVFSSLMDEISKQIGELSSQNSELRSYLRNILQLMIQVLEVLSGVIRLLCAPDKSLTLGSIRSLPSCVLKLLKDTFEHCKDSEAVYCGRLSVVADLLQGLFKEAYTLQKGLMELLDKTAVENKISEEEISDIVIVIHSLLEICTVISNLDVALHANTWKFIIKQSIKHQALLEEHLRHGDIVTRLCDDLLASFYSSCELAEEMKQAGLQEAQCPEYKLFQKSAKMCRFFANTLVHYVKEFKAFLSKSCGRFYHLYLQIFSKLPPSLWSAPMAIPHGLELSSGTLTAVDVLVTQLLPCRAFVEVVLAPGQELVPETLFPHCLLLVSVVTKLRSQPEEVLCLWCEGSRFPEETPRPSVFQAVFRSFRRCSAERAAPLLVPGVMMNGQAQSQVTLHQHVCIQLCACVAALPASVFPNLERSMLEAVLQPDTQTALLATDIWCFLARFGTAELCLHHVKLAAHLIKSCPGESHHVIHLGLLLRRLLFLMTPQHQMELIEKFPPGLAENQPVWRHVLLRALSDDGRKRVQRDVAALASDVVGGWLEKGCRLGELEQVNVALSSLLVVAGEEAPECLLSAARLVKRLWPRICAQQVQKYPAVQQTVKLLFSISAVTLQKLDSSDICQALTCLSFLLSMACPDHVLLAGLDFLASLGGLFIPPEIQNQVLPKLCSLFSQLLGQTIWPLHQYALEAFSRFAEVTNHEEVIAQSLTSEGTKTKVVNFLSKKVNGEETGEARVKRLKEERHIYEQHCARLENEEEELLAGLEPCSKRARQLTSEEEEFEKHLQMAESTLAALHSLAKRTPVPQWASARLRELQTLITQIGTAGPPRT
ncbi:FIGNL1-interacting regulator of recombination and mitosis [Paramormyrops kingsleyae]|uniref:FIGNL1-interacting regulator of recombination and mitosis n=1 Tax=Paramormyrops kingsleyae TaxID=1676925 RepID=UPI003B96C3A5